MSKSSGYFLGFLFRVVRIMTITVSLGAAVLLSENAVAAPCKFAGANTQQLFDAIKAGQLKPDAGNAEWTCLYKGGKVTPAQQEAISKWDQSRRQPASPPPAQQPKPVVQAPPQPSKAAPPAQQPKPIVQAPPQPPQPSKAAPPPAQQPKPIVQAPPQPQPSKAAPAPSGTSGTSGTASTHVTEEELGKMLLGAGYEKFNQKAASQSYLEKNTAVPDGSNSVAGTIGYHPGIDYRAQKPLDTYSPVNGVVEHTYIPKNGPDVDPGKDTFGTIVVKIDGSETRFMFMHMSSSYVSAGTKVSVGCVVGRTGGTGIPKAPHLHVEARDGKRNAALYFGSASNSGVNKDPTTLVPKFVPVMTSKKCG